MLWTMLEAVPVHMKHLVFKEHLKTEEVFKEIFFAAHLAFVESLAGVLQSVTPPKIGFFKSLATDFAEKWGVYVIVLEKSDHRPQVYIGSGTNSLQGVDGRVQAYGKNWASPQYVSQALQEGFTITAKGLLCWMPLPSAGSVPRDRLLVVALEAFFTAYFWALRSRNAGAEVVDFLCPWDTNLLEYDGLCSHFPLQELPFGDHSLSTQQLEEYSKTARSESVKRHRAAKKAEDPQAYFKKANDNRKKFTKSNPASVKASTKRAHARARAMKKFYCATCDAAFPNNNKLRVHCAGPRHLRRAADAGLRQTTLI